MGKHETYWNGLEQYHADAEFQKMQKDEFREEMPIEALDEDSFGLKSNRRDFLKVFGFGMTAAALSACVEKPIQKAIPYVVKPENVTPGVASWYASTCGGCSTGCGVLVKSREGRPIKIEGNELHPMNLGGTCPVGQATVLNLYDSERLMEPRGPQGKIDWAGAEKAIGAALAGGGAIYVVSNSITSRSSRRVLKRFMEAFPGAKHVSYDSNSNYAFAKVHSQGKEQMEIPSIDFAKAEVIVSFDADFLGTWISPVEYTKSYVKGRKLDEAAPKMSKHIQFESRVSLTGSNADVRFPMTPSQLYGAVGTLYNLVVGGNIPNPGFKGAGNGVETAAKLLKAAAGKSLVVSGINDVAVQAVVKAINEHLGNYGNTLDLNAPSYQVQGDDAAMLDFAKNVGSAKAVIFLDEANPVYDFAGGKALGEALARVPMTIAFTTKENETSKACKYALPQHHYLEAWDDANPKKGLYSVQQPLVRPLYNSRQWQDCLLAWSGEKGTHYDWVVNTWETELYGTQHQYLTFKDFWDNSVRDGYFQAGSGHAAPVMEDSTAAAEPTEDKDNKKKKPAVAAVVVPEPVAAAPAPLAELGTYGETLVSVYKKGEGKLQLVVHEKNYMRSGRFANNPWLQEVPDPISKVTWDNYVAVPYGMAMEKGWKDGDKVTVAAGKGSVVLPIIVQPGQANNSIAIAVGYGRGEMAGRVAKGIGENAYPFIAVEGDTFAYHIDATINPTGEKMPMAKTQTYIGYDMQAEGGDSKREWIEERIDTHILKETTLSEYQTSRIAGNKRPSAHHMLSLWDIHDKKGHHWGMAIDLNACTGCGNCIVSCNAENNIAMVGKDEVAMRREMHWMRIDRYFKGHPDAQDGSLQIAHQPMLCQHCNNAPCETVCPVLAIAHSDEGINQQVYNRCVGTRYCANNCPYKVRRFNWFSYYWNDKFKDVNFIQHDKVGRLVLNPDVTVRARGVMEKCSFCVQRIQDKKLKSKSEGRRLQDGEVKTACQQSCPADAIVFGDLNDANSEIAKLFHNKRGYHAIEDVKTLPNVLYMTKVRNVDAVSEVHAGGDHA
jgi:molybdopterin-containing oxidoreductase family iron-sulfur binding subunit